MNAGVYALLRSDPSLLENQYLPENLASKPGVPSLDPRGSQ
jgi:hypothetical protein